jgi:hypothetical protein
MDWLPGSDRLGDADWWWDVAFDGIASSLLAASLAFVGIYWALRHDRQLATTAALNEECRTLYQTTRETYTRIRDAQPMWRPEEVHQARAWLRDLERLVHRRATPPQTLSRLLTEVGQHIGSAGFGTRSPTLLASLVTAEAVLFAQLTDPDRLEDSSPEKVDRIVSNIREGNPDTDI